MSFSTLKGFFFYYSLIRKDLLNKLNFLITKNIPKINNVQIFFMTNQKYKQITNNQLFSLLSVLEFLTNSKVNVIKCDTVKLDHFNRVNNLQISVFLDYLNVYEIFLRSYFLWYRSLPFTSEEFSFLPGMSYSSKLKKNTRTGKGSIEYIRYSEPFYFIKPKNSGSVSRLTTWSDFTLCAFVPIDITSTCLEVKMLFTFSTHNELHIKSLLSGLRILHRFKKIKK